MRLLYVALTRAADRLIVSGVMPKPKKDGSDPRPPNCWHRIVEQAHGNIDARPASDHVGTALRGGHAARPKRTKDKVSLPSLSFRSGPAIRHLPKRVRHVRSRPPQSPSTMRTHLRLAKPCARQHCAAPGSTNYSRSCRRWNRGARPGAANRWLGRSAGVSDPAVRDEIVAQVCGILSDPQFAELFGANSFGEAPLAATLPDGRVIAGTADRLLIEKDRVSVLDFKTGRVPASAASYQPRISRKCMPILLRCGSSSRTAKCVRRSSTPAGRNCSSSSLERRRRTTHMLVNTRTGDLPPWALRP